ncbi:MAG: bifunctional demethylmenaquinone methyltransferase/2-methoxy-6-polyprenyl-1,4-benzoquinol methylase UbiE [Bdellovibrionales bacterium]|nr:bifunctional demethylmenaquinone methyltransferase/2-methoxy-6-polyprenyl-1,4-benzoquinol methylase UbiE [Bdellovibrionales bacterium]NQZ17730.1 bifunctional demethylmenaquinone methyltransferase/2-methoxy-6-polyprenyl-1,4-benzoquinol methylase UbiE [Bdellovibrionales bacterium]
MDKREQTIKHMFSEIAGSYDTANSVLSLGIHHLWKQKVVNLSKAQPGMAVLDCATGTGDLALLFKKTVGAEGRVVGTDFCQEMLDEAPLKAQKKNLDVCFQLADVSELQFGDNQFDVSSISFGIRNVENRIEGLKEMARVTKSGGSVMILEFGQIETPVIKPLYNFYSQKVLPYIGGVVSGKPKAYQYLNDSSQVFPCGQDFADEVMSTGRYERVDYWPLSFGIAYIYKCTVK